MRRQFFPALLLAVALSAASAFGMPNSQEGGPMVTVLCYHHVDCPVKTDYSVTGEQLSAQIDALLAAGFSFIDSQALESFYGSGTPIPEKSVLVTFDDGNYDVYSHAWPILRKKGIPFTFFVYPATVSAGHAKHCVDWNDLKEMAAAGVTIGSHTMTHPFLTQPPAIVQNRAMYDIWLNNELVNSRAEIAQKIGKPVTELAVPFGAFDSYIKEKIRAAGYSLAFNVDGANSDIRADRMNINRIIVRASMSPDYFMELASAPPIYFLESEPADLSRIDAENTLVAFRIDGFDSFDKATVKSKVTSFRGLDLQHIRDTDRFIEFVDLRRPTFYGVYVWAKDLKGRLCRGSWLFIFEKNKPAYLLP